MCGLVGMAGDFMMKHRDMMKDLLFFDTLRGSDSTGVSALRADRQISTRKVTVPGYEYIQMPWINDLLQVMDRVWLGHNRFKTVGAASRLNAHPFEVYDDEGFITMFGAHNGTLKNKWSLENELKDRGRDHNYGTDSEVLMNLIDAIGFKEAIAKTEGAWALTTWIAAEDSLVFLRNSERPLTFAYSDDRKTLFWASESWMLRVAASRHGIKFEDDKVFSMSEDTLYKFKIPSRKNGDFTFAPSEREGGLLGKPEKVPFSYGSSWMPSQGSKQEAKKEVGTNTTTITTTVRANGNLPEKVKGFRGKEIDREWLMELIDLGCSWAGCDIGKDEPFGFLDEHDLVCKNCIHDTHYKEVVGKSSAERTPRVILTARQQQALELARK